MEEKAFDGINIFKICLKCFILEIIISIIGMFILAVILSNTSINDNIMGNTIIGISSFAISIGAFLSSRKLNIKGIVCGILQGVIYMLVLYIISSLVSGNFSLKIEGIIMIIVRNHIRSNWRNSWC